MKWFNNYSYTCSQRSYQLLELKRSVLKTKLITLKRGGGVKSNCPIQERRGHCTCKIKKYENTYINTCRYKYIVCLYTDVKFQVVNTLVQIWAVKLSRQGGWHLTFPSNLHQYCVEICTDMCRNTRNSFRTVA